MGQSQLPWILTHPTQVASQDSNCIPSEKLMRQHSLISKIWSFFVFLMSNAGNFHNSKIYCLNKVIRLANCLHKPELVFLPTDKKCSNTPRTCLFFSGELNSPVSLFQDSILCFPKISVLSMEKIGCHNVPLNCSFGQNKRALFFRLCTK